MLPGRLAPILRFRRASKWKTAKRAKHAKSIYESVHLRNLSVKKKPALPNILPPLN